MQYAPSAPSQREPHPLSRQLPHSPVNHDLYAFHSACKSNLREQILRLRYEVFCRECGFIWPDPSCEGIESDPFDACAVHFAATTMDNAVVGTVRLVQPISPGPFPFELHCDTFLNYAIPGRELCAEVSRLAVQKDHRRRPGDATTQTSPLLQLGKNCIDGAQLLMGMFREMYRYSVANGVCYWFAAMERSLARSLREMGFAFTSIGPPADYFGIVQPYVLDLQQVAAELVIKNPALAAWFGIAPGPSYDNRIRVPDVAFFSDSLLALAPSS